MWSIRCLLSCAIRLPRSLWHWLRSAAAPSRIHSCSFIQSLMSLFSNKNLSALSIRYTLSCVASWFRSLQVTRVQISHRSFASEPPWHSELLFLCNVNYQCNIGQNWMLPFSCFTRYNLLEVSAWVFMHQPRSAAWSRSATYIQQAALQVSWDTLLDLSLCCWICAILPHHRSYSSWLIIDHTQVDSSHIIQGGPLLRSSPMRCSS